MSRRTAIRRRDFLRASCAGGLGTLAFSCRLGPAFGWGGSRRANETVRVAVVGVNGRGAVLAQRFATTPNAEVAAICDVDARVVPKVVAAVSAAQPKTPAAVADFRRVLDDRDVDALVIATPDHWHAPMTLLALAAGKDVYLEKPCGATPREDELLVESAAKRGRHVQIGTQRRSSPLFFEAAQLLKDGAIGRAHLARTWYANKRGTIGKGKAVAPPKELDWELWQGPAPRTDFRDNVVHYNWHWFRRWGTGEVCNNGTHEIDVARWLLGVELPARVSSSGTRFQFDDDWEFPDTQTARFEFADGRAIEWSGQSCNGLPTHGRARGTLLLGTAGSLLIDQDGWILADLDGRETRRSQAGASTDAVDVKGDDGATVLHVRNFVDAVRGEAKLNAPVAEGARTALLCHLATISQQSRRELRTDPASGRILGDPEAAASWTRAYEPGWEPAT
jgi:predicted dehydrogenase